MSRVIQTPVSERGVHLLGGWPTSTGNGIVLKGAHPEALILHLDIEGLPDVPDVLLARERTLQLGGPPYPGRSTRSDKEPQRARNQTSEHRELLLVGYRVSERTVSRYLERIRPAPLQTCAERALAISALSASTG